MTDTLTKTMNLRTVTVWTTGITFFLTSLPPAWLMCVTEEPALTFIVASLFWCCSSAPLLVSLGITCCLKSDRSLKVILGATIVYVLLFACVAGLSLMLAEDGTWVVVIGILFLPAMIPIWIIALVLNVPPRTRKYVYITMLLLATLLLAIVCAQFVQVAEVSDGLMLQHEDWVRDAVFSPDGKKVATASIDGTACVWDAETGQKLHSLEGHEINVYSASFSPDGKKIVTGGNGTVRIWDADSGNELLVLEVEKTWIKGEIIAAFSPDGKKITALVQGSKTIHIWDSDSGKELQGLEKSARPASESLFVVFSPDSNKIVTTSDDSFWSSDANGKLQETKEHTIHVFDADSGKRMQTLKGHTDWVRVVAFSSEGKKFVTASDDGTARIWDTNSGENLQTLRGLTGRVLCTAFLPDDKKIITAGDDGIIRIWDADSGELLPRLGNIFSKKSRLQQAALSPDGKTIAMATSNGTVKVVDIESGSIVQTFARHTHWFFTYSFGSIAFSLDNKRIVTASSDHTARIWILE